ncbi:hypothetical protein [uncultured Catenibacterium sp.]|nr:hypothetical protein [uncultured Catenibacterium sp.]
MRRLYASVSNNNDPQLKVLHSQGFTVREMEVLTTLSKSNIARRLKEVD